MSKIQKALNELAMTRDAVFMAKADYADICLHDDGSRALPIKVGIIGQWFDAAALRKAAKLFKALAKQLEIEGRTS